MPLRLDPRHPPLWRTPTAVQFGLDPVAVVDADEPWHARLIAALERGLPAEGLAPFAASLGAAPGDAETFVRELGPALYVGPTVRVMLRVSGDVDPAAFGAVHDALLAAEVDLTDDTDAPLVVVASHLLDPRTAARLMGEDRTYLPVVLTTAGVEVGPLVVPGRTACAACLAATRHETRPWWPAVAAQLVGAPPPPCPTPLAAEAGLVAARLLTSGGDPRSSESVSWTIRSGVHPRSQTHRPHEDCACRSPAGIGTDPDLARRAPTTATATAVPV